MKYSLSLAGILLCGSLAVQAQPADQVLGTQPARSAASAAGVVTATGGASSAADAVVTATAPAPEQVQAITQAFTQRFPGIQVDAIRLTPVNGLYEVQVGLDLLYTDAQVDYVLQGSLIDAKARRDLTAERLEALQQVAFASLPLDRAIRQVKGTGERKVAVFEDPNCGYCKQLHRTLEDVDNITVYTFLFPILTPDSVSRSRNIWCAADPAKAWKAWMLDGEQPATADCPTPIQDNLALGRKLNIQGTPAMFFADGSRVNGALPLDALKKKLDAL
ncbi:DsbC family protein [Castellaniella sp.]|uniref:DsbC family protein n=1 Tax=Castellaniella sp. TaxID=1955812 RepID=UPI002AFFF48A|nr:DsbC family protein [Castellaniella sp.]